MKVVNIVEKNGKIYFMNGMPEQSIVEALIKFDPIYANIEELPIEELEEVRMKLSIQAANAAGYITKG